jgi:hypothetical protein
MTRSRDAAMRRCDDRRWGRCRYGAMGTGALQVNIVVRRDERDAEMFCILAA